MANVSELEKSLGDLYKGAPKLPQGFKKALVQWLPWLSLIAGLVGLWGAWGIWNWARVANDLADFANRLSAAYGGSQVVSSRWSLMLWIGVIVLVVEAVIYLLAFPGLRDRKKAGWNYLFYGELLNVAYGIVVMFTSYGGVGNLIGSIIGTAIGFYFLFQIRDHYTGAKSTATAKKD
jgi:hypothetical protein